MEYSLQLPRHAWIHLGQQSRMRFRGICREIYLDRRALALDPGSPEDLGVLPPLVGEELA